jgi:aromatic ring-opening dioxygenase catalytic subunit (LigB family)
MKRELGHTYDVLEASLKDMPRQIGGITPTAVLVVSGHWEAADFAVMANPHPPMLYDYYGFPAHTYQIHYDAPGSPALAARVQQLLQAAGLPSHLDTQRGFDHGTFVPMYAIYPEAQVPIVQLSLQQGYDPATHLAVGRALASLRDEGVLIVGSGLSYHNLRDMGPSAAPASRAFDDWLHETLTVAQGKERVDRLLQWDRAPGARRAHPQEDHLIPLLVAVGAAENDPGFSVYREHAFMGGPSASSFRFGEEVMAQKSEAAVNG